MDTSFASLRGMPSRSPTIFSTTSGCNVREVKILNYMEIEQIIDQYLQQVLEKEYSNKHLRVCVHTEVVKDASNQI